MERYSETLEPKLVETICVKCGKPIKTLDDKSIFVLSKLFPLPKDYWRMCNDCRMKVYALLPPDRYLKFTPAPEDFRDFIKKVRALLTGIQKE